MSGGDDHGSDDQANTLTPLHSRSRMDPLEGAVFQHATRAALASQHTICISKPDARRDSLAAAIGYLEGAVEGKARSVTGSHSFSALAAKSNPTVLQERLH
jgi:hypothetical protein